MKVLNAAVPKEEGKSCNAKYQCLLNTLYLVLFSNLVIYDCLIKMAIYCPQGSGTLRQQLLMMH